MAKLSTVNEDYQFAVDSIVCALRPEQAPAPARVDVEKAEADFMDEMQEHIGHFMYQHKEHGRSVALKSLEGNLRRAFRAAYAPAPADDEASDA